MCKEIYLVCHTKRKALEFSAQPECHEKTDSTTHYARKGALVKVVEFFFENQSSHVFYQK